ncbi:MAG: hypothetical protein IJ079_00850 [Lachnospiraceae bacterium]|nr:hypothetical protein [Lachnospiraceae bacterium]
MNKYTITYKKHHNRLFSLTLIDPLYYNSIDLAQGENSACRKGIIMITLDYIKPNTICSFSPKDGTRIWNSFDNIKDEADLHEFDEAEKNDPEGQKVELRPFWLAYRYAIKELGRNDLTSTDAFYAEWAKDPDQFKAAKRPVIDDLRSVLKKYEGCPEHTAFHLENYDGLSIGHHNLVDYERALEDLDNAGFDVVNIIEYSWLHTRRLQVRIILQCDDQELVGKLAILSMKYNADRIFGE